MKKLFTFVLMLITLFSMTSCDFFTNTTPSTPPGTTTPDINDDNDEPETSHKIITNEGVGLPSDSDGVYDLDFTKGEYIKNVSDQTFFVNGCPTVGSPGVLVIPVQFSDATAESNGFKIDTIVEAF